MWWLRFFTWGYAFVSRSTHEAQGQQAAAQKVLSEAKQGEEVSTARGHDVEVQDQAILGNGKRVHESLVNQAVAKKRSRVRDFCAPRGITSSADHRAGAAEAD